MPAARKPRLTPKRDRALALLLAGRNFTDVADELGVDRRTVFRWRQDPDFEEALAERQDEVQNEVHHVLVSGAVDVALAMRGIALNQQEMGHTRVQAGKLFFELLGRHKGSPVQPATQEDELETEEDVVQLLEEYPLPLLEQALENKRRQREL